MILAVRECSKARIADSNAPSLDGELVVFSLDNRWLENELYTAYTTMLVVLLR